MTQEDKNKYMREYRKKNKKKVSEIQHRSYMKHREARLAYRKAYREKEKAAKNEQNK